MERKPKSQAERIAEREQAVLKHNQKLAEARMGKGKSSADIPSEIDRPHPKANKAFMAVGFLIVGFLILTLAQMGWNAWRSAQNAKASAHHKTNAAPEMVDEETNAPVEPQTEDSSK
jgi:hypothetical protein